MQPIRINWKLIVPIIAAVIGAIGVIIAAFISKPPSPAPTPTPILNNQTPTPTSAPALLYQVDFSKGEQGWLSNPSNPHSSQWFYNTTDKVLESDGSTACCSDLSKIALLAPHTFTTGDYVVEARIRVTGINRNNTKGTAGQGEPFFALYVRGVGLNTQGYFAGINGIPIGESNAKAFSSFVAFGQNVHDFHGTDKEGESYSLDEEWHTYRLEVKGDSFMLKVDNVPVYSKVIIDNHFSFGPNIGLEDYDCTLQVQWFTVSPP